MEKIYVLEQTYDHLNDKVTSDAELVPFTDSGSISILLTSKKINLEGMVFYFKMKINDKQQRDYLYSNVRWPIFSEKMALIIDLFDMSYKIFPVLVAKKNKETLRYKAYQILPKENLIDFDKSKVYQDKIFPDIITRIERIVLTNEVINVPQIFRIKEYPIMLFLRESLAIKLINANLEGVKIVSIDEYNWLLNG